MDSPTPDFRSSTWRSLGATSGRQGSGERDCGGRVTNGNDKV